MVAISWILAVEADFEPPAARQMGARVTSFDFDPDSVKATTLLKSHYAPRDTDWKIDRGSVLDVNYLAQLENMTLFIHGEYCTTLERCGTH